jgi:phage gpG-like protein
MVAVITVQVTGDVELIAKYDAMARRNEAFQPVLTWARNELVKSFSENFSSNGLLVGGWAPLDPTYATWKAVRFPGRPTLVQNGRLFKSLVADNAGASIGPNEFVVGTNLRYAKFHQYGTTKMPKREILFEPRGFKKNLKEKVSDWIIKGTI